MQRAAVRRRLATLPVAAGPLSEATGVPFAARAAKLSTRAAPIAAAAALATATTAARAVRATEPAAANQTGLTTHVVGAAVLGVAATGAAADHADPTSGVKPGKDETRYTL